MSDALPRGVAGALRRLLPADLAEPIAGDLAEEFASVRASRGRLASLAWIWWQVGRFAVLFRWERGLHGRGVPPIGDELRPASTLWDGLRQDVRYSVRTLRRQPGFTAVALLALALGIGANTAIFSIVDAVLWRPLPYAHADRVMALAEQRPRESRWWGPIAPADFFDWRRESRAFAAMAAYSMQSPSTAYNLTGSGEPERVRPLEVTPAFFGALGVVPALGRDFLPDEETYGRHRVVLLSDELWRRRFGADRGVVGRSVAFNGYPYEIVGVLPAGFWWPSRPDVVVPLALDDHDRGLRAAHFLQAIGRRRDDVAPAQATNELSLIGARLSREFPEENANHAPNARSLRDALVGDVRPALLVLFGAVGVVMVIACANVATLLLARAAGRQKELSVRRAVGATRGRVVQQLLTESLVIALAGGGAGLLVAAWSLAVVRTILPAQFASLPGIAAAGLDGRVLAAAFGLSTLTGIAFGIVPALVVSDARIGVALTEETRGSSGGARVGRLRAVLVVAEVALSLVLLTGAALLIVSFDNLLNVSPGFQTSQLTIARLTLPSSRYGEHIRVVAFFDDLLERLGRAPGVQRVAVTTSPPFDGLDSRLNLVIENRTVESPLPVRAHPRIVSTDYFRAMGIPLIRGRVFNEHDSMSSVPVVILNDAAVRRYWPDADPIGRRISLGAVDDWREIVGVVGDTRHEGLDADADPAAFLPHHQVFTSLGAGFERTMTIVVRSASDATAITSLVRTAAASVDPQVPIGAVRTMEDVIADTVAPQRLNFLLVTSFALLAVVLTAAGLYGVMAYLVAQRTREIGVRMALGATRRQVLAMMFSQAGAMTGVGIGLGVGGALLVTRSIRSLLFGVSATDPLVYAGVSMLLALVALAAVAVPSARATRVDPLLALRDQ